MSDTKTGHSRHHAEAYRKGYLAGRRGCTGANNPYENDSREARAWIGRLCYHRLHVLIDEGHREGVCHGVVASPDDGSSGATLSTVTPNMSDATGAMGARAARPLRASRLSLESVSRSKRLRKKLWSKRRIARCQEFDLTPAFGVYLPRHG
jgi:hypothetical protein